MTSPIWGRLAQSKRQRDKVNSSNSRVLAKSGPRFPASLPLRHRGRTVHHGRNQGSITEEGNPARILFVPKNPSLCVVRILEPRSNKMECPNHVQEHIDTIVKHEQDFLSRRTSCERMGDSIAAFIGSLNFVIFHLACFLMWIFANTLGFSRHFDPFPFSLLGTCVSLEAILVASFILMRQARLARRADERDHLMLHRQRPWILQAHFHPQIPLP